MNIRSDRLCSLFLAPLFFALWGGKKPSFTMFRIQRKTNVFFFKTIIVIVFCFAAIKYKILTICLLVGGSIIGHKASS